MPKQPVKKVIPFEFLLDYLPSRIAIKPAIGMFYIYWENKILLIFRQLKKNPQHNGIWISTERAYHASLKAEMPSITDFVFDDEKLKSHSWLHLKDDHDDFEKTAIRLCELINQRDKRIGRATPKAAQIIREARQND